MTNSTAWESKGCAVCRQQWESGNFPPRLATNIERHAQLHQCAVCGTFWEQHERAAEPIPEAEAKRLYAVS